MPIKIKTIPKILDKLKGSLNKAIEKIDTIRKPTPVIIG